MNAETLNAMPEGAKLMMRVGLMSELEKMRTLRMAVFALFAYDVLTTLGTERRVMWSEKPSIMGFFYFCCRYLYLIFQIINMVLERAALSEKSCARLIRFVNGPPIVSFICGSVIFIQRLYAIYGKSLRVSIPLYFLLAASVAVQVLAVVDTRPNPLPPLLSLAGCIPAGGNRYYYAFHGATIGFHFTVVLVTSLKIWQLFKQSDSHLLRVVLRDSLGWFVVVTVVGVANLIYYLYTDETRNRALLSPLVAAFESLAPARMMLSLRGAASANILSVSAPQLSGTAGLPLTPTTPTTPLSGLPGGSMPSSPSSRKYLAPPMSPLAMGVYKV